MKPHEALVEKVGELIRFADQNLDRLEYGELFSRLDKLQGLLDYIEDTTPVPGLSPQGRQLWELQERQKFEKFCDELLPQNRRNSGCHRSDGAWLYDDTHIQFCWLSWKWRAQL